MIRIGYARHFDAENTVQQCLAQIGDVDPTMLLVFCGGKHNPQVVLTAIRDDHPDVPVVGGSAAGAITRAGFGYSGLEIVILALIDRRITPRVVINGDLLANEFLAGRALGEEVARLATPGAVVLMLFDSVAQHTPLRLHFASSILDGVHEGLAGRRLELLGGGLLTDMNLTDGWVFDGDSARKHVAVALIFPPEVRAETVVFHGCRPVSTFMEITRIEGAEVFELDGQPALSVIERMLGMSLGAADGQTLSLIATLGEKQGDRFAPYDENAYVNRLILTLSQARGSVTLFEPDFHRGAMVQIMSRDNNLMLESVRQGVAQSNLTVADKGGFVNLYVDCVGRASAFSGATVEEAELVLRGVDPSLPLVGFYSGVEIAPFGGYSRPLDWTGVLTTLRLES
jgi:hypothetical protein